MLGLVEEEADLRGHLEAQHQSVILFNSSCVLLDRRTARVAISICSPL